MCQSLGHIRLCVALNILTSASWLDGGTLTEVGQNGTTPLELGVTTPVPETKPQEVG